MNKALAYLNQRRKAQAAKQHRMARLVKMLQALGKRPSTKDIEGIASDLGLSVVSVYIYMGDLDRMGICRNCGRSFDDHLTPELAALLEDKPDTTE